MQRTSKILKAELYAAIAVCMVIIVLFETNAIWEGAKADDATAQFAVLSMMELIVICSIPVSLRLFKVKSVKRKLTAHPEKALLLLGSLRLQMLCIPMVTGFLCYYLFMNVAFFYMSIILLLCLFFIYPSMERCKQDTDKV